MEFSTQADNYTKITGQQLDEELLELTERDPSGRFLMEYLCELVDAHNDWSEDEKWLVYESLELMYEAHDKDDRGNDDAYVTHPLRVAIDLCVTDASPQLVAAGLLHDSVEDKSEAVIEYIMADEVPSEDAAVIANIARNFLYDVSREDRVNSALLLLEYSPRFAAIAHLVNEVTNRAYPLWVDSLSDDTARKDAKHAHRAEQINRHVDQNPQTAVLKFADTYDNIRSLRRHEALNGRPDELGGLMKLHEKYSVMIQTWESLAETRPTTVTRERVDICKKRLNEIQDLVASYSRNLALANVETTGVKRTIA